MVLYASNSKIEVKIFYDNKDTNSFLSYSLSKNKPLCLAPNTPAPLAAVTMILITPLHTEVRKLLLRNI